MLRDPSEKTRKTIAKDLSLSKDRVVVRLLGEALDDQSITLLPSDLTVLLRSLARIGDPTAAPFILPFLHHQKSQEEARLLGDLGDPIREAAALALGDLGDPSVIPALERVLTEDWDQGVQSCAFRAITKLGGTARPIWPQFLFGGQVGGQPTLRVDNHGASVVLVGVRKGRDESQPSGVLLYKEGADVLLKAGQNNFIFPFAFMGPCDVYFRFANEPTTIYKGEPIICRPGILRTVAIRPATSPGQSYKIHRI